MDLSGSMRIGTCLGFDFYPPRAPPTIPTRSSRHSATIRRATPTCKGPAPTRLRAPTVTRSRRAIPPPPTASYSLTYVNNFYQNAAYATTLVRAFDSYTSTDGGNTWTAPTSGTPLLPPSSYASVPGGDVPLFKRGAPRPMPPTSRTCSGSTHAEHPRGSWTATRTTRTALDTRTRRPESGPRPTTALRVHSTATPRGPAITARPSSSGRPTRAAARPSASDSTRSSSSSPTSATPLDGLQHARSDWSRLELASTGVTTTTGSQNWPWPNDGGTTLSTYLTTQGLHSRRQPQAKTTDSQYQQIMPALQPGTTWSTAWARPPATGGCASSAPTTTPMLFNSSGIAEPARKLHVHDQLQRDPPLDHPVAEPLPDAVAGGPHQVLRIDPDGDHRDLAQLRQHRPAVLGRVHRLRARLQADVRGQSTRTSAPWPATAAISPGEPSASPRRPSGTAVHELHR